MKTFYDDWLGVQNEIQDHFITSPGVARDKDIPWVSTPQDAKVKLMIGSKLGFATMGSNVLKAEIPVGWHTGKHRHGEESMHILEGEGFSIIDGRRFDWHKSSSIHIPFWAEHQHFNTGDVPVLYLSGMIFDLEHFVNVARLEQLQTCGPNDPDTLARFPSETSQYYDDDAGRAVIHIEQAPANDLSTEPQGHLQANQNQHDFIQTLVVPANGFKAHSVAVTHQWIEPPFHHSGRHAHLEAVVYAVEGSGTTDMAGKPVPWEAGDVLYVPPAMWEHEHFNDNPDRIVQVRIAFNIRFWFTEVWPKGFTSRRVFDRNGKPIEAGRIVRERQRER
jgi:mannose-6-phosphate isomerase-like protein (cupin superfamily)